MLILKRLLCITVLASSINCAFAIEPAKIAFVDTGSQDELDVWIFGCPN